MILSVGASRQSAKWKPMQFTMQSLYEKLKQPVIGMETLSEYLALSKDEQTALKDTGGFVAGVLQNEKRSNGTVLGRTLITLDLDNVKPYSTEAVLKAVSGYSAIVYSTRKHCPEKPRLRILLEQSRMMTADEYEPVCRKLAENLGLLNQSDPTTYEAARLMFWPSLCSDSEYICELFKGKKVDVDAVRAQYTDWQDPTSWPQVPGADNDAAAKIRKGVQQQDPLTKTGLIGSFCRAYPISELIAEFLSDIYEPLDNGRYTYKLGTSSGGAISYEDKFLYSHHASDPASGKLLNAYDLLRLHKFQDDSKAMDDFAAGLDKVSRQLQIERIQSVEEDFGAIENAEVTGVIEETLPLKAGKHGIEPNIQNLETIMFKDRKIADKLRLNEFTNSIEVIGDLPWYKKDTDLGFFSNLDFANLKRYLWMYYAQFPLDMISTELDVAAGAKHYHPIKDYLEALPQWDGNVRAETLLIDYLGAEDNDYVRAVTRKTLVAAVARIYEPGCKFDTVLTLNGAQGIGKSSLFSSLLPDEKYFSDSLDIRQMSDKEGRSALQGKWILELGELKGLAKADIESYRSFVTCRKDTYRPAYGRMEEQHPRQCILVATVNGGSGFLRDESGNRRNWVVDCLKTEHGKPDLEAVRDQIWAEALYLYRKGERIYLIEPDLLKKAEQMQKASLEDDDARGILEMYLDMPRPENWDEMSISEQSLYFSDYRAGKVLNYAGKIKASRVCASEVIEIALGEGGYCKGPARGKRVALLFAGIDGWQKSGKMCRFTLYGMQRYWERTDDAGERD